MPKDKKESRLSFRITPNISDEIDKIVKKNSEIKDRSDFGTRAINLYIDYLRAEMDIKSSMKDAIVAISEKIGAEDLDEVQKLREFIERYDN